MSRQLGPVPSTPYEHLTSDSPYGSSRIRVSHSHRIDIERPSSGAVETALACGTCGDQVEITVMSVGSTKVWRLGWLLGVLLSVSLTAACVVGIVSVGPDGGGALIGSTAGFVFGLFCVVYTVLHWWHEDGVRGPGLPWRSGRHFVRHFWAGPR